MFMSLSDYKTGFGGQFGVQTDRVDKSAVGWEHHEKVEKHESQKGELCMSALFSCYKTTRRVWWKIWMQTDGVHESAAGWEKVERVAKHPSHGFQT